MILIYNDSFIYIFISGSGVANWAKKGADGSISRCDEELLHLNHPSGAMNEITHQILSIPAYWINLASSGVEKAVYEADVGATLSFLGHRAPQAH